MLNPFDDLTKFNNMDAAMKSLNVISKGVQALAAGAADYSKKSLEQGAEAPGKDPQRTLDRTGAGNPV